MQNTYRVPHRLYVVNNYSTKINHQSTAYKHIQSWAEGWAQRNDTAVFYVRSHHLKSLQSLLDEIRYGRILVSVLLTGSDLNIDERTRQAAETLRNNRTILRAIEGSQTARLFGICYGAQVMAQYFSGHDPVPSRQRCKGYYPITNAIRTRAPGRQASATVFADHTRFFPKLQESIAVDVVHIAARRQNFPCQFVQSFRPNDAHLRSRVFATFFHPESLLTTQKNFLQNFFG